MTDPQHPAAWHPDPSKRHQSRYWDEEQWTEHVSDNGQTSVDEEGKVMANTGQVSSTGIIDGEMFGYTTPQVVQAQVAKAQTGTGSIPDALSIPEVSSEEVPAPSYTQTIFTEKILVVNQKAKLMELTAEYGIFDQAGNQIGSIREVGQSAAKKVARALLNIDAMMTHRLEIVDMNGEVLLRIVKPRAFIKAQVIVEQPDGTVVGALAIKIRIGKAQIKIMHQDQQIGMVFAENFRAWNFSIKDNSETQIASITKTWEGFGKALFTTADNYVVQIHQDLQDPMHSLVLAASLAVDLILKQNDKGLL